MGVYLATGTARGHARCTLSRDTVRRLPALATLRLPTRRSQGLPPRNSIAFLVAVSLAKLTLNGQKMTPYTMNGRHLVLVPTELCCEMVPDALLLGKRTILGDSVHALRELGGVQLIVSGKA